MKDYQVAEAGIKTDWQRFLVESIQRFVVESPDNRLKDIDSSPIYEEPLVGFADGDDSLFSDYKQIIGEFHLTPREALAQHLKQNRGEEPNPLPDLTVISWILPIAKNTKQSNRKMVEGPSLSWNHTRWQGEAFNDLVRRYVVSLLADHGYPAVAPMIAPFFKMVDQPRGFGSNWSERHAAYAAGLGTFSLNDGLITSKGMAMRCGSVVAGLAITPSPRPYQHHMAYCPYIQNGSCGACIERCPGGAIGPQGHDKHKCHKYMLDGLKPWMEGRHGPGYIGSYPGCGLCQTKVPCESRIPTSLLRSKAAAQSQ